MSPEVKPIRCAVYTRKSSDEGLEQSFNSLHAQREACEAYVMSQKHEGWQVIPTAYDDGGFSGGNMERPGLKKLLEDIATGKLHTVVVYKVDRLTRSLADFARIVESFDKQGVSFVSVTQQFNTTSSMGRLTLIVLLSFAQFEREVTGERIRDKVAASKKKGMWMGGHIPIGYDLKDRGLVINDEEAATVRDIFATYLRLKSVFDLQEDLARGGILSKRRTCSTGRVMGGNNLSRGTLYHLLSSPLYIGKVPHRGKIYDGLHEPIIDPDTWKATTELLKANSINRLTSSNLASGRPLLGLLVHEDGSKFTPSHATKKGRRYPYYVSRPASGSKKIRRLPTVETELAVINTLRAFLSQPLELSKHFPDLRVQQTRLVVAAAQHRAELFSEPNSKESNQLLRTLVSSVTVGESGLCVGLLPGALLQELLGMHTTGSVEPGDPIALDCPFEIKRRGSEVRFVLADGLLVPKVVPSLARAVARARDWMDRVSSGELRTMGQIAEYSGLTKQYVRRILKCGTLSPSNTGALLEGRHSVDLTVDELGTSLPYEWTTQIL